MEKNMHEAKIRLINKVIDIYFEIDVENRTSEMSAKFRTWLRNGEYEEEKTATLKRKFEEICKSYGL